MTPEVTLAELLTVEPVDDDRFRSTAVRADPRGMFGGQLAAQSLRAAAHTVARDLVPHSLHGYFVSRGDPGQVIDLLVHRDRDGRSYCARRVEATQGGRLLFTLAASFHRPESGPDVQEVAMPRVPPPEGPAAALLETRAIGIEFRDAEQGRRSRPSRVWARLRQPFPTQDPHLDACALTYASDMFNGLRRLAITSPDVTTVSLDHAVWFHRPVRLDQWLLIDLVPRTVADGRGLYTGSVFGPDGTLIASMAQECLYRRPGTSPAH